MQILARDIRIGQRIRSDEGEVFAVVSIVEIPGHPDWIAFEGWTPCRIGSRQGPESASQRLKAERVCQRDKIVEVVADAESEG